MRKDFLIVWTFFTLAACLGVGTAMGQPGLRAISPPSGPYPPQLEAGHRTPKSKPGFFNRALRSIGYGWSDGYHAKNRPATPPTRSRAYPLYPLHPGSAEPMGAHGSAPGEFNPPGAPVIEITPPDSVNSSHAPAPSDSSNSPPTLPSPAPMQPNALSPESPAVDAGSRPSDRESGPSETPQERYPLNPLNQTTLPKLKLQ